MTLSNEDPQKALARLREFPLFSSVKEDDWEVLSQSMTREQYERDVRVISAGENASDLFWIEEGEVSVFRDTPFGPQPIADLPTQSLFGELSLIDGRGRSTDVQTKTRAVIWRIDGGQLAQLFEERPPLACLFYRYFWASLAQKINLANNQIQKFFGGKEPTKQEKQHSRPAWFAPPKGIQVDSSSSIPAATSGNVKLTDAQKRRVLEDAGLAPPEIELLFKLGEEMVMSEDEAVFHEGDFGDTLYFIVHGQVRISKKIEGIGEEALAILERGQFFGEMALVSENAVRSADCYAHEGDVLMLAFRLHMLNTLEGDAEHDYPFLSALCKMMTHRLREINERLFSWKMMTGGF